MLNLYLHLPSSEGLSAFGDSDILASMPSPSRPPVRKAFREVELVRLYTDRGHPWLGLVALALRMGVGGAVVLALIDIARLLIERFL